VKWTHLEQGNSRVFRNVGILHHFTATQLRRPRLESSSPWIVISCLFHPPNCSCLITLNRSYIKSNKCEGPSFLSSQFYFYVISLRSRDSTHNFSTNCRNVSCSLFATVEVITNYVSDYINLLVRLAHIICNHRVFCKASKYFWDRSTCAVEGVCLYETAGVFQLLICIEGSDALGEKNHRLPFRFLI